jgi:hypothetical protein
VVLSTSIADNEDRYIYDMLFYQDFLALFGLANRLLQQLLTSTILDCASLYETFQQFNASYCGIHSVPLIPSWEFNMIDQHLETTLLPELRDFTALLQLQLCGIAEINCMNAPNNSETTGALFLHCDVTPDILTECAKMSPTSDILDQRCLCTIDLLVECDKTSAAFWTTPLLDVCACSSSWPQRACEAVLCTHSQE